MNILDKFESEVERALLDAEQSYTSRLIKSELVKINSIKFPHELTAFFAEFGMPEELNEFIKN